MVASITSQLHSNIHDYYYDYTAHAHNQNRNWARTASDKNQHSLAAGEAIDYYCQGSIISERYTHSVNTIFIT